jgi:hypothetical protein
MCSVCEDYAPIFAVPLIRHKHLNWQFILIFESKTDCNGDLLYNNSYTFCTNRRNIFLQQQKRSIFEKAILILT